MPLSKIEEDRMSIIITGHKKRGPRKKKKRSQQQKFR
jgi:hypothetical protein